MNKQELGKAILKAAYLEGDFTLRSGAKSKYYLDKYLFGTKPEILRAIAKHIVALLPKDTEYDRLAAPELGAVTLVAAIAMEVNKPFVIVRKGSKDYGTSKLIEGDIQPGEKIVIVEDILTSGGAALEAAKKLVENDNKVLKVIGIINREQGADKNFKEAGFVMDSLFTKTELGI